MVEKIGKDAKKVRERIDEIYAAGSINIKDEKLDKELKRVRLILGIVSLLPEKDKGIPKLEEEDRRLIDILAHAKKQVDEGLENIKKGRIQLRNEKQIYLRGISEELKTKREKLPKRVIREFQNGYAFEVAGEPKMAYEVFSRITSKRPKLKEAWYEKGRIAEELGNNKEAIDCYLQALKLDESYVPARASLISVYNKTKGYHAEAKKELKKLKSEVSII